MKCHYLCEPSVCYLNVFFISSFLKTWIIIGHCTFQWKYLKSECVWLGGSYIALSLSISFWGEKELGFAPKAIISKVPSHASHVLLPKVAFLSGPVFYTTVFERVVRNKVEYYDSSFNEELRELGVSICIGLEDVSTAIWDCAFRRGHRWTCGKHQ